LDLFAEKRVIKMAFSNDQQDRGTRGDMANRQIDWQE